VCKNFRIVQSQIIREQRDDARAVLRVWRTRISREITLRTSAVDAGGRDSGAKGVPNPPSDEPSDGRGIKRGGTRNHGGSEEMNVLLVALH
jgi:hypothetical protein